MVYYGTKDKKKYWFYEESEKDNLIKITKEFSEDEKFDFICQANAAGKVIEPDDDGNPVLVDPPEPTEAEKIAAEIAELKEYLSDTDYAVIKIAEGAATAEEYAEVIAKRQAARVRINELENE